MTEIRNREDLLAWLRSLPPLERAQLARVLASVETTRALREIGDAAVFELTREQSWAAVAEQLGVGTASINKAVQRYNGRPRPRKWPAAEEPAAGE